MKISSSKQICCFLLTSILVFIGGCSKDDDIKRNDIIGSWHGTISYYNPAGGTKYQYLTLRFFEDKTGEFEYESPVSLSYGYFKYSVHGNTIECKGAKADSYGDVDEDFTLKLRLDNERLYPQNMFTSFILTRDGSIITDTEGNIISGNDEKEPDNSGGKDIANLIVENVKATKSYSDYVWTFNIESSLESLVPNQTIRYGVGHGDIGDGIVYITYGRSTLPNTSYEERKVGGNLKITIKYPFYMYYVFGMEPSDESSWGKCDFYYSSYLNLKTSDWSSLSSDQKQFYNNLVKYLDQYESTADRNYKPSVWVGVGDRSYPVNTYYEY